MAARPLRRVKTSAAVVDYLLEQIFSGQLRSGDRIDFDAVGAELGVSRLPVREALVVLERDGLIATVPHRGSFVEPFDADSISDDFEILGLLSGVAVARLARRRDPEVLAQLESLLEDLRSSRTIGRASEIVQEIVRAQHRAGGSRRLRAELRSYAGFLPWAWQSTRRTHKDIVLAHTKVIDAIVAGDPEAAARHRVEDFRRAGDDVVKDLVRRGVIERPS
ncbi:MAG TPA: GntR family transcriptional regulator [Acidimicrobiales bacterium]|nr:GntR family transcriptional regulator [Acidimicrobiales bacterium]